MPSDDEMIQEFIRDAARTAPVPVDLADRVIARALSGSRVVREPLRRSRRTMWLSLASSVAIALVIAVVLLIAHGAQRHAGPPPVAPGPSRPTPQQTLTGTPTPPAQHPVTVSAAEINDILTRTVEVDNPTEHFGDASTPVTIPDGAGGTFTAVAASRTPSADGKGDLVFFWHNDQFVGWDADQEALVTKGVHSSAPRSFAITYSNYAAADAGCCATLPPVTVTFRWNGHAFVATTPIPPGVYGLNNPSAHAIHVRLWPAGSPAANLVTVGGATLSLPAGWTAKPVPNTRTTWCLLPATQTLPANGDTTACAATFFQVPQGSRGVQLSPDTTGGEISNPNWCGQVLANDVTWRLLDYRNKTFGGRDADYRRWTITCKSQAKTWRVEQYVIDSGPAYVVFSARADAQVHAILRQMAANSTLPPATGGLRYSDFGRVRAVTHDSRGYHISLDRVVTDQGTGKYVKIGGPYDYVAADTVLNSTRAPSVGALVQLTTDGVSVTWLNVL